MGRLGSAHEGTPARAGKMAKRTACRVVSRHGLRFARTSSKYGKAQSAKWLAIRAGRPGVRRRTAGGAGATPPKTALACTAGPFGEVAPEIVPCRKAGWPQGAGETFAKDFRTVMSRPPSTRSASRPAFASFQAENSDIRGGCEHRDRDSRARIEGRR